MRESIERARAMMAADQSMTVARFFDSDDGQPLVASLSAVNYLSFLDPQGLAAIGNLAEKVTLPVLWISNGQDNAYPSLKAARETMQIPRAISRCFQACPRVICPPRRPGHQPLAGGFLTLRNKVSKAGCECLWTCHRSSATSAALPENGTAGD